MVKIADYIPSVPYVNSFIIKKLSVVYNPLGPLRRHQCFIYLDYVASISKYFSVKF